MTDAQPIALACLAAMLDGDFAGATSRFAPRLKDALSSEQLESTWSQIASAAGGFTRRGDVRLQPGVAATAVLIDCEFADAVWVLQVAVADGRIVGLQLAPRAEDILHPMPRYIDGGAIAEEEVTVGAQGWPLPGTFAFPKPKRLRNRVKPPFRAIVFVHGSGPNDRDETVGGSKVFLDLGLGLASRGIATLRYEKRTKAHRARVASELGARIDLESEVIDDALAAVAALRARRDVDPDRIFICGHSLGGALAPAIGAADPRIAGLISLAGATRPMEDLIIEQSRYLASLIRDDAARAQAGKDLKALERQAAAVKKLTASSKTPADKLPLALPPSYWRSLAEHDPMRVAAAAPQPMLVLQGERDYQVTMADFEGWKRARAGRDGDRFVSYKSLNHLFTFGKGPSTPAEYAHPRTVDKAVVDDIAKWVNAR